MKKALYIIATVLEVLLLGGAYVFNYFTKKKMGMARWVVYMNQGWERGYPVPMLKNVVLAIVVILAVCVLVWFFVKRKELGKMVPVMVSIMSVLTALYTGFTLIYSKEALRAYYFISLMFAIAAVIQTVKTAIGILVCKNEK